ncbi:hypothetical protein ABZ671_11155 [Micromonospora sp. NPDC006766]
MRIDLVTLVVAEYDPAITFFTKVLAPAALRCRRVTDSAPVRRR